MNAKRAALPISIVVLLAAGYTAGMAGRGAASPRPAGQLTLVNTADATPSPVPVPAGSPRTITVQGVGSVEGTPDLATVSFSISTQAAHVSDALSQNNKLTAELTQRLVGAGVDPKDISTNQLWISPNYNNGSSQPDGYQVNEGVTAKLRDLGKAGQIIDGAAQGAGDAIRLGGIYLSFADTGSLMAAARTRAVQAAHTAAGQYASAAGMSLGAVRSISEAGAPPVYPYPMMAAGAAGAPAAQSVPIQPGQQSVQVTVTVVYDLG